MAGGVETVWDSKEYWVPLMTSNGQVIKLLALAMEQIMEDLLSVDVVKAAHMFKCCPNDINRPSGSVDLLIGIHNASIFPKEKAIHGNLMLLSSQFGSGMLLQGAHPSIRPAGGQLTAEVLNIT